MALGRAEGGTVDVALGGDGVAVAGDAVGVAADGGGEAARDDAAGGGVAARDDAAGVAAAVPVSLLAAGELLLLAAGELELLSATGALLTAGELELLAATGALLAESGDTEGVAATAGVPESLLVWPATCASSTHRITTPGRISGAASFGGRGHW